ncbi:MAG: transglutaminase family protein [Gammaproteobacteria bacterium]|nr:transglutaminase family protein [Gammaproteobacteria bacterium]MCY4276209.1 transglutaminase family protein [Gammaproteobacteria bacterium]
MTSSSQPYFIVDHHSVYTYSEPATESVMTVYLQPLHEESQQLHSFEINIDPITIPIPCNDSFGNRYHLFNIHRSHMNTTVHSRSVVQTSISPNLPESLGPDAWECLQKIQHSTIFWDYLVNGKYTKPSRLLADLAEKHNLSSIEDPLQSLRKACNTLHKVFTYEPNSTSVDSSIEQILTTGKGVCQDYSHVMIALARSWGIPSRYVSGYLFLEGVPGEQSPQGASHAWAEFWLPEIGWIGFDPTNNSVVDHRHIRLARGRDYSDVSPTRGVLLGGGDARLEISVTIRRRDEENIGSDLPKKTQQIGCNVGSTDLRQLGHFEPKHQMSSQQ